MPLGTEVGLGPGDMGTQVPPRKGAASLHFSAHVCCICLTELLFLFVVPDGRLIWLPVRFSTHGKHGVVFANDSPKIRSF